MGVEVLVRQLPQQRQPPQADSGAEQFLKLVQDPFKTAVSLKMSARSVAC